MADVIVLGAGIVGVSVAIHLQMRGRSVVLLDRREPGRETSFGNAGIIQSEGIRPRAFPRDLASIWRAMMNRGLDVRYDLRALPRLALPLARYWWHSKPSRYEQIVREYAPLIAQAVPEHAALIDAAGAGALIRKQGWLLLFRSEAARDRQFADTRRHYAPYGVGYDELDGDAVAALEPDLQLRAAGALRWTEPWEVADPGALVQSYAQLFQKLGGRLATGDAQTLRQAGSGWSVATADGPVGAAEVVVALGPWSDALVRQFGYRLPLFVKRGYHMHYAMQEGTALRNWLLDAEAGYLLAPMQRGVRLTTGAELAALDAAPSSAQLDGAERIARNLFPLADRLDAAPWMGARPCTPDMKPIVGPAPRHRGMWFAFGHAHHGLTLGPVTGRLLAEQMTGETPFLAAEPFLATRFKW